jgi:26S proteasome regulatory subunit N12
VEIEQYLMEGRYNKVFIARHSVPAPSYSFFMEFLLKTIRDEIASCIEKAYERLSFTEARRMLSLESDQAMTAYAQERSWTLNGAEKSFAFQRERKVDDVIPATQLAQQAIEYARELEMIV